MAVDISKMSRKDLEKLQKEIDKTLANMAKVEKREARKAAEKAAAKFGFSLAELTGAAGKSKKSVASAAPKFANPEDPSQTWSGRGRQPQWYKDAITAGKKQEDLAVA